MEGIKCAVKGCETRALILYGSNWICGKHLMEIINKESERKNKQVEELGNDKVLPSL